MVTKEQVCKSYDHALLRPFCKREEVEQWCADALRYGFASICINPCEVAYAKSILGEKVKVGTVVGYPQGANTTKVKIAEGLDAIDNGASELDMVMNISRFKEGDYDYVQNEIAEFVKAVKAKDPKVIVKIIIEMFYIEDSELPKACEILINAGADYIKEATGYAAGEGKAGDENLQRIKSIVGDRIKIKSAHSIHTLENVISAIESGASRVGSNNVQELLDKAGDKFWEARK